MPTKERVCIKLNDSISRVTQKGLKVNVVLFSCQPSLKFFKKDFLCFSHGQIKNRRETPSYTFEFDLSSTTVKIKPVVKVCSSFFIARHKPAFLFKVSQLFFLWPTK